MIYKRFSHVLAIAVTIVLLIIIKKITILLYAQNDQSLSFWGLSKQLLFSGDPYLQFIFVMNFLIKPAFAYFLVLVCMYYIRVRSRK